MPCALIGSPGHAWSFEIDTSKLHGVKTCDGACCNAEKFVKLIALQLNMPSKWDVRVSNPCTDEEHAKYQAALDRAENPLSPTEREKEAVQELRRLALKWRHRNGKCGTNPAGPILSFLWVENPRIVRRRIASYCNQGGVGARRVLRRATPRSSPESCKSSSLNWRFELLYGGN